MRRIALVLASVALLAACQAPSATTGDKKVSATSPSSASVSTGAAPSAPTSDVAGEGTYRFVTERGYAYRVDYRIGRAIVDATPLSPADTEVAISAPARFTVTNETTDFASRVKWDYFVFEAYYAPTPGLRVSGPGQDYSASGVGESLQVSNDCEGVFKNDNDVLKPGQSATCETTLKPISQLVAPSVVPASSVQGIRTVFETQGPIGFTAPPGDPFWAVPADQSFGSDSVARANQVCIAKSGYDRNTWEGGVYSVTPLGQPFCPTRDGT